MDVQKDAMLQDDASQPCEGGKKHASETRTLTVGDVAPKVLADDDVPGRSELLVKLLFDLCGNVFLDVVLFESSGGDVDGHLLHLFTHIDVLDDGLGEAGTVFAWDGRVVGIGGRGIDFLGHGGWRRQMLDRGELERLDLYRIARGRLASLEEHENG